MSEGVVTHGEVENGSQGIQVVHVSSIPNQSVQVQSVIQSNQQSVIHSASNAGVPTIQVVRVAAVDEDVSSDDSEARRRREILARRPSYRKILNDLSSPVTKMDEESNSSQSQDGEVMDAAQNLTSVGNTVQYQQATVVPAGTILAHADGTAVSQGLQTLTMTNTSPSSGNAAQGTTIVQYAQGPDGQFYIPVGGTNMQAYQIATTASIPQGVVMASAGSPISSGGTVSEEASRKRELRLLKNREAARECRIKKKEYVKCLENRVAVLENQNKTLIEELKALKELYCQKE